LSDESPALTAVLQAQRTDIVANPLKGALDLSWDIYEIAVMSHSLTCKKCGGPLRGRQMILFKCELLCSNCHAETHRPDLAIESVPTLVGPAPAASDPTEISVD